MFGHKKEKDASERREEQKGLRKFLECGLLNRITKGLSA